MEVNKYSSKERQYKLRRSAVIVTVLGAASCNLSNAEAYSSLTPADTTTDFIQNSLANDACDDVERGAEREGYMVVRPDCSEETIGEDLSTVLAAQGRPLQQGPDVVSGDVIRNDAACIVLNENKTLDPYSEEASVWIRKQPDYSIPTINNLSKPGSIIAGEYIPAQFVVGDAVLPSCKDGLFTDEKNDQYYL